MFINAICFGVEDNVRKLYGNKYQNTLNTNSLEYYKIFALSGAIAGFAQSIFLAPVELVKIKMQIPQSIHVNTFECVKYLFKKGGAISLMRGLNSTIIRDVPSLMTYFVSFEYICNYFKRRQHGAILNDHDNLSLRHVLVAGGVAGCLSWIFTYPIDVIKTRYQADQSYKNYRDCLSKTFQMGGHKVFWRGLAPTLLRYFVLFFCYKSSL
jgi:solute carrier family 25 (mitochondrial carnitine/acylcarnitine transporter), member 20/29